MPVTMKDRINQNMKKVYKNIIIILIFPNTKANLKGKDFNQAAKPQVNRRDMK